MKLNRSIFMHGLALSLLISGVCAFGLQWEDLQRDIQRTISGLNLGHHSIETKYEDHGRLTVTGYVASQADEAKVLSALTGLDGVREVENKLTISQEEGGSDSPEAELIRKSVLEAVKKLSGLGSYEIDIVPSGSTVTLSGTVASEQDRTRIERTARSVAGVKTVVSNLKVLVIPDSTIEKNVWTALRGEKDLDVEGITVTVSNGVVTVHGTRPDHRKIDQILSIVNMADGVKEVKSQMKIG